MLRPTRPLPIILAALVLALAGCNLSFGGVETETPGTGGDLPDPTLAPITTPAGPTGDFFVTITEPTEGPGGEPAVVDPAGITVYGEQRGSFENNVVVQALDAEGNVLEQVATTAIGELGEVGIWEVTLSPMAPASTEGQIVAFFESAQDGSVLAEDRVRVVYGSATDDGAAG